MVSPQLFFHRKKLFQGDVPLGFAHSQKFHNPVKLPDAGFRRKHVPLISVGDEPCGQLSVQIFACQRRCDGHGVFVSAFIQLPCLHVTVEVDENPDIAGQPQVKLLGHHFSEARGAIPMDAADAVAEGVFPHACGVGSQIVGAPSG